MIHFNLSESRYSVLFPSPSLLRLELRPRYDQGATVVSVNLIEGSLNIRRDNSSESQATPRYRLMFAGYEELKAKRQPCKQIVGDEALEVYLLNLCFAPEMAKHWLSI